MGSAALDRASREIRGNTPNWTIKDFEKTPFHLIAFSKRVYDQKEAIVDHHELELFVQRIIDQQPKDYKILRVSYSKQGLKMHELKQPRKSSSKETTTYIIKGRQKIKADAAKRILVLMKEYENSQYSLFGSHCQSFCREVIKSLEKKIQRETSGSVWEIAMIHIKEETDKRRSLPPIRR